MPWLWRGYSNRDRSAENRAAEKKAARKRKDSWRQMVAASRKAKGWAT